MTDFEYSKPVVVQEDQSDDIGKLALALSKAQGKITGALKDSTNPFFKSKYADLAAVWDACREHLAANELAVIQTTKESEDVVIITTLAHSSGQWIRGSLRMKPTKNDPQGVGSAITYGRRYGLAAITGVAQIDDDAEAAHGRNKQESYTGEQKQWFDEFMKEEDALGIFLFSQRVDKSVMSGLFNSFEKGQITKQKELHRKLESQGADVFFAIEEALESNDGMKLAENIGVLNKKTLAMLKSKLNEVQKSTFDELYKVK